RTVEAVESVRGGQTIRVRARVVVGDVRRTAHTAGAGAVLPGLTRLDLSVQRFIHQDHVTRSTRRGDGVRYVVERDVVQILGALGGGVRPLKDRFVLHDLERVVTTTGNRRRRELTHHLEGAVAQGVVPDHFESVIRNREGRAENGFADAR